MDLMKLLRSFEEFIFEAITWLVFYPLTLWRIVTRPLTTMAYSDAEQERAEKERYADAVSPPLQLLITVIVVNAFAGTLQPGHELAAAQVGRTLLASAQNLAIFRALVFSLIPLVAATTLLRHRRAPISRETLRSPFYAQCYLATPCCIALGLGFALLQRPHVPTPLRVVGAILLAVGGIWFFVTQVRWFRSELRTGWALATWCCAQTVIVATVALILILTPLVLL